MRTQKRRGISAPPLPLVPNPPTANPAKGTAATSAVLNANESRSRVMTESEMSQLRTICLSNANWVFSRAKNSDSLPECECSIPFSAHCEVAWTGSRTSAVGQARRMGPIPWPTWGCRHFPCFSCRARRFWHTSGCSKQAMGAPTAPACSVSRKFPADTYVREALVRAMPRRRAPASREAAATRLAVAADCGGFSRRKLNAGVRDGEHHNLTRQRYSAVLPGVLLTNDGLQPTEECAVR